MERLVAAGNSGLKGVLGPGGAVAKDAEHGRLHAHQRERQLPVSRLGLQRADADHPEGLRRRDDLGQGPERDRCLEAHEVRPEHRARRSSGTTTGGAARPRSTASSSSSSTPPGPMVTAYQGDQVDAIIQFDILSGKTLLDDPNFTAIVAPAALHRQIWMRTDKGQFADKRVRQALALTLRPAGAHPAALPGQGAARQRPPHLGGLSVLRLARSRSGRRTSRRPSRSCRTPT